MVLALNISYGKLKGDSKETTTWYPATAGEPWTFSHQLTDASLTYEYNFRPYGTGREYRGAQPFTPFIAIGLGLTVVKTDDKTETTFNMPIGLGVKYKVAERVNLSLQWMMHFSNSDKLDGVEDPYGIKRSGLFKNTDSYSMLQMTVSYDIWAKCKTCNNDRY